jgi:hypothetical protein
MNESEAPEDPFFVSMRILKALLQHDQDYMQLDTSNASAATEPRTPIRTATEVEQRIDPPDDFDSLTDNPIDDLRAKLQSAEATVEKERRLRLAVERERDDILVECEEAKKLFESPLPDDIVYLKKEALRLIESRQNERSMHLKEMDHLHLKMQQAISRRDSMQARLLASQNTIQELERKLTNAREIIQVYVAISNNVLGESYTATLPSKHSRSDNDSPSPCPQSRQGKSAKVSEESREQKDASRRDVDKL